MTALPAPLNPFGQYLNLAGTGLNLGHIWIGEENQDPESFPKQVYWDTLGTDPALQPLDVVGGYVYRDGAPAQFFVSGAFSIRARNRSLDNDPTHGVLVFYLPSVSNPVSTIISGAWPFPMALGDLDDGPPTANQWLGGICVPWAMQLPADLAGSLGQAFFPPLDTPFVATLRLNSTGEDATTGTAIGTFTIAVGGAFTFTTTGDVSVDLPAGSHIDWYAPADSIDANLKGMKWTWLGYVQGDGSGAFAHVVTQAELDAAVTELQEQIDDFNAALALKADIASPTFTGIPAVPTALRGVNTTQAASTAFVADATSLAALATVFTQSLGTSGFITLPDGLIFQWNTESPGDDTYAVYALPTPFLTTFMGAVATVKFNNSPPKTGGNGGGAFWYPEDLAHIGLGIAWDGDATGITTVTYLAWGK